MKVLITRADGRDLGLVFEQRRVVEVFPMETDILPFHPGDIILGQVQDVAKSLKAAFIRLLPSGKEQTECGGPAYLALQDVLHPETRLVQGNLLPVQIIAEPSGVKPYRVTGRLSLAGRYSAVGYPIHGLQTSRKLSGEQADRFRQLVLDTGTVGDVDKCGIMIRTQAGMLKETEPLLTEINTLQHKLRSILETAQTRTPGTILYRELSPLSLKLRDLSIEEVILDPASGLSVDTTGMAEQAADEAGIPHRTYTDPNGAVYLTVSGLHKGLENLIQRRVYLKSGAYLVIDRTEALCAVDVNSGKSGAHAGRGRETEDLRFAVNQEAAEEVFHQIRARNLSGMILIDFINMNPEHTELLGRQLRQLCEQDPLPMSFVDYTGLGLAELTRKKTGKPLEEWWKPLDSKLTE